jgi:hypothetical protein
MSAQTITETDARHREAQAYAQCIIDQAGSHAAEVAAYAARWVGDCYYGEQGHRELLAARLTAYSEGYTLGYDTGQALGYQTGMDDGAMTAKRGGEGE